MPNDNLGAAKAAKNDEFYTQYPDIEKEVNAYLDYDPDTFRDKTVLLPCDDPEWSNFTKYFAENFERLGLKKLISTSYAPAVKREKYGVSLELANYEIKAPHYNAGKHQKCGRKFVLDRDRTGDGRVNFDDLHWTYLKGDGDFRSPEVCKLRDEADIIVTNPPFSLFREFVAWIVKADKRFLVIGNMNAITYKEIFPLIKENKTWLGATGFVTDMVFGVPEGTIVKDTDRAKAARLGYIGNYTRLGNSCWFTNLEHGRRHRPLILQTMEDNLKYNKKVKGYPKYDNYDAIEVGHTDAIPSDYNGVMGVPISFLDKYCPEQFEIVGSFNASSTEIKGKFGYVMSKDAPILINGVEKLWNGPIVNKQPLYKRICIRHIR